MSSEAIRDLIGATVTNATEVAHNGKIVVLDTDKGRFEIRAVAWSDVLANATDGDSDDLEVFVYVARP